MTPPKFAILLLVAISVGLLVYWVAGRPRPTDVNTGHANQPGAGKQVANSNPPVGVDPGVRPPDAVSSTPDAGTSIPVPRSADERERDNREASRGALYHNLHEDLGDTLTAVRPSDDDPATLDLYASNGDSAAGTMLLNSALRQNAGKYGFRHMRLFVHSPPGSAELFRLDAEANSDGAGNWITFKK